MNPDTVYALLVEANPIPDPDAVPTEGSAHVSIPHPGSETMLTLEPETHATATTVRARRRWPVAAAAAMIVIAVLGALAFIRDDDTPAEPANPIVTADASLPSPPTREETAVATASAFYRAVNAGDVDTVIAMSNPDYTDADADRQMWEMLAVTTTHGQPWTIGACVPVAGADIVYIEVACEVVMHDPVWEALAVANVIAPVRVFDDLSTQWRPFRGADFSDANRAYAEYFRAFRTTEYETVCDPSAYEPGTVNADAGLALTKQCAELWVPLAEQVAQWIIDGRPAP